MNSMPVFVYARIHKKELEAKVLDVLGSSTSCMMNVKMKNVSRNGVACLAFICSPLSIYAIFFHVDEWLNFL